MMRQQEYVLRTVEERLGRLLSDAEVDALVQGAVIRRDIDQSMQRDLSAAEPEARAAVESLVGVPPLRASALAVLDLGPGRPMPAACVIDASSNTVGAGGADQRAAARRWAWSVPPCC